MSSNQTTDRICFEIILMIESYNLKYCIFVRVAKIPLYDDDYQGGIFYFG